MCPSAARTVFGPGLALVAALIAAACGGNSPAPPPAPSTPGPSVPGATIVTGTERLAWSQAGDPWRMSFRAYVDGRMVGDTIASLDERPPGEALLVPAMRDGEIVLVESLVELRARACAQLDALPDGLRALDWSAEAVPYPVTLTDRLRAPVHPAVPTSA